MSRSERKDLPKEVNPAEFHKVAWPFTLLSAAPSVVSLGSFPFDTAIHPLGLAQETKETSLVHEIEFVVPDVAVDGERSPYIGGVFRVS